MTATLYSITTDDGYTESFADDESQALVSVGNLGASPVDFQVFRGYKHHGEREFGYSLKPRSIAIDLWAEHESTRQAYFDLRARILDLMRPNRGGPMTLTVLLPDMQKRSIRVRGNPGPVYPATPDSNFWGLRESIELVAFDPIWFDPDSHDFSGITYSADRELVFPIDFPIWFGEDDSTVFSTGDITYLGTWDSYPTITLHGPYDWARVQNSVIRAYVALVVPIRAGETRTINLTPGKQSIVDGNGDSRFGELAAGSNLLGFGVKPAPRAPGGVQVLSVTMQGKSGASSATLSYNDRYYAI